MQFNVDTFLGGVNSYANYIKDIIIIIFMKE